MSDPMRLIPDVLHGDPFGKRIFEEACLARTEAELFRNESPEVARCAEHLYLRCLIMLTSVYEGGPDFPREARHYVPSAKRRTWEQATAAAFGGRTYKPIQPSTT